MSAMIAFNHRITDEAIALVRLASDEGAVLHLVRLRHEPATKKAQTTQDALPALGALYALSPLSLNGRLGC